MRASRVSTSARAPNVHQVLTPLITQPSSPFGPGCRCGGDLDAGDVAAVVGLGDGHGGHHLGRGQLREPLLLLLLGAALDERPREDLGPGDQRAADAEARLRQLLGGGDHGDVLRVAALAVAAVLGGHAEAERADLGEAGDDLLGHVAVGAVDVLGVRCDHVGGERRERVGHHLHVVVEMSGSGLVGERREELGCPELRDECVGVGERIALDAPGVLAAEDLAGQVVEHVGSERARDLRFDLALRAVVEQRSGGGDAGCGVGDVVGEHLVLVGSARGGELADGLADHTVGEVDGVGGSRQVGSGDRSHVADVTGR